MKQIPRTAQIHIKQERCVGLPLSKDRIAIYDSGLVPIERYERDQALIAEVDAESFRVDLGWGAEWMPWMREVLTRRPDGVFSRDYAETDRISQLMEKCGTRPYWSYCYVPAAARPEGGDWRTMADDDGPWIDTVSGYVRGMQDRSVCVGYHEIYNEPDLRDEQSGDATFYTGDVEDYIELYRETSQALREADPSCRIGGPALALPLAHAEWLNRFLTAVVEEGLPLDFISFHHYGHLSVERSIATINEVVDRHPELRDVELHLNEYNSFPIDYPRGGIQDSSQLAAAFAADVPVILSHRQLTRTHWAQFLDSGNGNFSGMVDIDGIAKPLYDVYSFYQHMPVDRVGLTVHGPEGFGSFASATPQGQVSAVVWNRHFADVNVEVRVDGVARDLELTLIQGVEREQRQARTTDSQGLHLSLPAGSVVLIAENGAQRKGHLHRRGWGIPLLGSSTARGWSDFDESECAFLFGTEGGPGWLLHGAEVSPDLLTRSPAIEARRGDGTEPRADVALMIVDGDGNTTSRALCGRDEPVWVAPTRDRAIPAGRVRCVVAVRCGEPVSVKVTLGEEEA